MLKGGISQQEEYEYQTGEGYYVYFSICLRVQLADEWKR